MNKIKDNYKKWIDIVNRFDDVEDERKVELNMYKVRWVFYHTILGIELFLVILLLFGIYLKL
jgi:hypothetical protein